MAVSGKVLSTGVHGLQAAASCTALAPAAHTVIVGTDFQARDALQLSALYPLLSALYPLLRHYN